jgi:hypothetical protein
MEKYGIQAKGGPWIASKSPMIKIARNVGWAKFWAIFGLLWARVPYFSWYNSYTIIGEILYQLSNGRKIFQWPLSIPTFPIPRPSKITP